MSNHTVLEALRGQLLQPEAQQALKDIETLVALTMEAPAGSHIRLAPALARGLSYYTGPIFEVVSTDFSGSLGGGGRYDNLVGMFSNKQVPAVGFSLGLERILLLMEERQMFPALQLTAQVMVCVLPEYPAATGGWTGLAPATGRHYGRGLSGTEQTQAPALGRRRPADSPCAHSRT